MILKFEDFITEQIFIETFDIDTINEASKLTKRMAEIAKKQIKLWNSSMKSANEEYTKAIRNIELMRKDYQKYSKEVQDKLKKFNEACREDKKYKSLQFSLIISQMASIKEIQTNLFKNGLQLITNTSKNIKDIITRFEEKGLLQKEIQTVEKMCDFFQKQYRESLTKLMVETSTQIKFICNTINNNLDDLEKFSDVTPVVFADPKIENKHKRTDSDFITIHHSDIAKFVKDYKLVGIEYDKRIKLVDADEIKRRLVKKIGETIKEHFNKDKKSN